MIRRESFTAHAIYIGGDARFADQLEQGLDEKDGWSLQRVVDVDTALTTLGSHPVAVAILGVADELTHAQALKFLRCVERADVPTVVVADQLAPEAVLELFQRGAAEILTRPVSLTRLFLVLDMLTARAQVAAETASQACGRIDDPSNWHTRLMEQVNAVAALDTTVLITGETGTGKTRLSRLIHGLSPRQDKPFLAMNCGALSESLLDSELFGHVRGAFTGAERDYPGKLSQCGDGTLLLDEVDMLTPAAQVKLLQVVEDRIFQPVGSTQFEPLHARLIVASNRSLEMQVAAGKFRSDLFYRLNVMAFELPPLRKRVSEIRQLATRFAAEFARQHDFAEAPLAASAVAMLESYTWPGNIRELRNVIERAVILSAGASIQVAHLPAALQQAAEPTQAMVDPTASSTNKLANARFEAERELLLKALRRNDNNRSKTALDLGISRVALYKRLRKLHLM